MGGEAVAALGLWPTHAYACCPRGGPPCPPRDRRRLEDRRGAVGHLLRLLLPVDDCIDHVIAREAVEHPRRTLCAPVAQPLCRVAAQPLAHAIDRVAHLRWPRGGCAAIRRQLNAVNRGVPTYLSSRLQAVAGGCRRLQAVAVGCSRLQAVAGGCRRLQSVAGGCRRLQAVAGGRRTSISSRARLPRWARTFLRRSGGGQAAGQVVVRRRVRRRVRWRSRAGRGRSW